MPIKITPKCLSRIPCHHEDGPVFVRKGLHQEREGSERELASVSTGGLVLVLGGCNVPVSLGERSKTLSRGVQIQEMSLEHSMISLRLNYVKE